MKRKYFIICLLLWLSVSLYIFHNIYNEAKEKAIYELNSRQMIHARQAKSAIEDFFSNSQAFLNKLSESDHVINFNEDGKREMDFFLKIHQGVITAITRIDTAGRIAYTTPQEKALTEMDISSQIHIQKILKTHQPVVSDVFTALQGYKAVAMHVPVFREKEFAGTLGILIDYRFISKRFLKDISVGETGYAWMTSEAGIELYCPVPGHTDKSVFENCKDFPTIIDMANEMLKGRQGITTYVFDRIREEKLETVKKHAVYLPITIADTFWSIIIASSEDEMLTTLEGFKNKLYLVVGLLLFGSLFFSYYTMKIWGIAREIAERIKAEASLKSERDMMHRIMETSPAGITRVDANGLVVYANERAEKILGIQRSDISSHAYNDPKWKITDIDGKPLPDEKMPFNIVKQTHKPVFDVQHCIESSDGNRLLLSINAMPLLNDSGIFDGMVAAIEDITEKFLAEQNYKMLFNKMIDGFALHEIICDKQGRPIDYRFLVVNPSFERLTGLKSEYLIGKTVLEVMPETESYWIDAYGQVALTGNPKHFENYSKELNRHFQVTAFRPAMKQFACIIVDISERKQAEKEIWESKERFQKVFNSHLDAIFVLNMEVPGLIIETNNAALKIFGYTTNEVIGKSAEILHVDEFHLKAFQEKLFSVIESEGSLTGFEFKMKRKDGTVFPTEHSVLELKNDFGKRTGWISIVCDLTNRKITEDRLRQAQKMESVGSLAGGIAHDLNNILFPISGLSEMLLDDIPPDKPEHKSIEQIHKSAKRGSDLVKQILAFSRQSNPRKLPIRIQTILKEVLKLAQATIPRNIEITSHINTDCGMISADPTQVHQIALNLITNAFHAVEGKGGMIDIALKEIAISSFDEKEDLLFHAIPGDLLAGRYACISVSDTGTGIDQTLIDKIFDPYFTTKELGKGTGLGLSVVHGIVKEHGGDIRVYSELGKGTVFHVYLPLLEDALDSKTATVFGKYPMGTEKILLVDDEEPIVLMVQMMLEKLGYQITSRLSSPDALAAFKANPDHFDLVISDRGMPNMTGEQLARELISIRPEIPVILCTGFSDENDENRARELGVKGFLKKPVAIGDLAEMVRKVLDEAAEGEGNRP